MKKEVMRHAVVMEKRAFPEHPWAEPPTPIWFKNHASSRIFFILVVAISVQMEDLLGIGVLEDWLEDVRNASDDTFLDLADYMPQEAAEALLSYAAHGILRFPEARRTQENQKTTCGKRHFEALEVDFDVVTRLSEVAM